MVSILKVVDQHFGADASRRSAGPCLRMASERVTAREIIRSRVAAEVEDLKLRTRRHDGRQTRSFIIKIAQDSQEARLNSSININGELEIEAECERAITEFILRRYIMLLDDRQIDDIDEGVGLRPDSEVVFVYLVPLKGG